MAVQHLGAFFIRVTNLERSIEFYEGILGLRLRGIEHWGPEERGATFLMNPDNDGWPLLTLIESDDLQVMAYPLYGLVATNAVEMHQSMREKGLKVTPLAEWTSPWNHHVTFDVHDPDGHPVNLTEVTPINSENNETTHDKELFLV